MIRMLDREITPRAVYDTIYRGCRVGPYMNRKTGRQVVKFSYSAPLYGTMCFRMVIVDFQSLLTPRKKAVVVTVYPEEAVYPEDMEDYHFITDAYKSNNGEYTKYHGKTPRHRKKCKKHGHDETKDRHAKAFCKKRAADQLKKMMGHDYI